jgi:hypothetical protein
MKLYAETAGLRARQLAGDLLVLAWTAGWLLAGRELYRLVEQLAAPGRAVEAAGTSFAGDVGEIQRTVGRIPVVGGELREPFGRLGGVGRVLADAGATQQQVVHDLALWLGLVVAAVPVVALLVVWLPRRVGWAREATAASGLRGDRAELELFALRAVANRPLRQLRRVSADPAGALRAGDYAGLAALELRSLGLRPFRSGRGAPQEPRARER